MSPWKTSDCCPNHLISNRCSPPYSVSPAGSWPGTEHCPPMAQCHPPPILGSVSSKPCVSLVKQFLQSKLPHAFHFWKWELGCCPYVGGLCLLNQQVVICILTHQLRRFPPNVTFHLLSAIFSMPYVFPLLLGRTLRLGEKDTTKWYFHLKHN